MCSTPESLSSQMCLSIFVYGKCNYFLIFCSAPPRYIISGKNTIAAVPFAANQDKECMINAKSALLLGASTPAGEKRGSFIRRGSSFPTHLIEYGGLETISSKGSSSQCCGFISVSSQAISNLSGFTS